jgi:hypothetical protein
MPHGHLLQGSQNPLDICYEVSVTFWTITAAVLTTFVHLLHGNHYHLGICLQGYQFPLDISHRIANTFLLVLAMQ